MDQITKAQAAIDTRTITYGPLHHEARDIQIGVRRMDAQIKDLQQDIPRLPDDAEDQKKDMEAQVATLEAERKQLEATIPANFDGEHKAFRQLLTADRRARLIYRRDVDSAYEPVIATVRTIAATPALAALKDEMENLRGVINSQSEVKAADVVEATLAKVGAVPGADKVRSELYKVRRALTGRTPDKNVALNALNTTLQVYESEVAWRKKAEQGVLYGLRTYEAAIHDTIGLRKQEKLPHNVVPSIAGCTAYHRDISLEF